MRYVLNRPTRAGSAPDEDDVSGTITVPEVAYDTEEDEYVVCCNVIISSGAGHARTIC